ncbi:MAG: preprotein translocase subunit SecE [Actinomycetota bacterium]|nr:preprotein translocase subunit SecE [Actinomycetota bacterium]
MVSRELRRAQEKALKPSSQQQKIAQRKRAIERKKVEKKAEKIGLAKRVSQFFKDVRVEMKKVIWPSRSEVVNYTVVVIITVSIVSAFILLIDLALTKILQLIV